MEPRILVTTNCRLDQSYPHEFSLRPTPLSAFSASVKLDVPAYRYFQGSLDAYTVVCNDATISELKNGAAKMRGDFSPVTVSKEGDFIFTYGNGRRNYIIRGVGVHLCPVAEIVGYKRRGTTTFCVRYDYDITNAMLRISDGDVSDVGSDEFRYASYLMGGSVSKDTDEVIDDSDALEGLGVSGTDTLQGSGGSDYDNPFRATAESFVSTTEGETGDGGPSAPISRVSDSVSAASVGSSVKPVDYVSPLNDPGFSVLVPGVGESSTVSSGGYSDDVSPQQIMDMIPGENAVAELQFMNSTFRSAMLSSCTMWMDLASAVMSGSQARSTWYALSAATPAQPVIVERREGKLFDVMLGSFVEYGGVCYDGELLSSREFLRVAVEGDIAITCEDMRVWVTDGIDSCITRYIGKTAVSVVSLMDAPASNGKTFTIKKSITVRDYAVCETSAALDELKQDLVSRDPRFATRCFTADSVLINDRVVDGVDVLYIDEALRLHAGKIWLLIRMLEPRAVVCYGDTKQIEAINFLEGYDFVYNNFLWDNVRVASDARTMLPAFAVGLSTDLYYNRKIVTYNKDQTLPKTAILDIALLITEAAKHDTIVLVYTQNAKREFKALKINNVLTIGEVQGKRYDHVILVRDTDIKKVLYYNHSQTLVAVTRARKSVLYMTAAPIDDSAAATLISYISSHAHLMDDHII